MHCCTRVPSLPANHETQVMYPRTHPETLRNCNIVCRSSACARDIQRGPLRAVHRDLQRQDQRPAAPWGGFECVPSARAPADRPLRRQPRPCPGALRGLAVRVGVGVMAMFCDILAGLVSSELALQAVSGMLRPWWFIKQRRAGQGPDHSGV